MRLLHFALRCFWAFVATLLTSCVATDARPLLGRKLLGSGDDGAGAAFFVLVVGSGGVYMSFKWCCCGGSNKGQSCTSAARGVTSSRGNQDEHHQPLLATDVQTMLGGGRATNPAGDKSTGTPSTQSNPKSNSFSSQPPLVNPAQTAPAASSRPTSNTSRNSSGALSSKYRSLPDWTIPSFQLQLKGRLGGGSFGDVFLGDWNGTTVAVKCLQLDVAVKQSSQEDKEAQAMKALQKEVAILSQLRHPNVVLFLGVSLEPLRMVTEFCERGSLRDVLGSALSSRNDIPWSTRVGMALDAARGMRYLHSRSPPILHCDLKSPNLLVDEHWRVKVGDFGLSHMLNPTNGQLSTHVGNNPRWMAPEVMQGAEFSESADVYAFGIILWELLTFEMPYSELNAWQISFQVTTLQVRPDIPHPDAIPGGSLPGLDEFTRLMQDCWGAEAASRPTFESIIAQLQHIQSTLGPPSTSSSSISPNPSQGRPVAAAPKGDWELNTASVVEQLAIGQQGGVKPTTATDLVNSDELPVPDRQVSPFASEGLSSNVSDLSSRS